jgi:hypothetical protein
LGAGQSAFVGLQGSRACPRLRGVAGVSPAFKNHRLLKHIMNDLSEMMARVDAIHRQCARLTLTTPIKKLVCDTLELQANIHKLQTVAQRMAAVSNFITRLIHRKNPLAIQMINLTPDPGDYARLRSDALIPCVPGAIGDMYVTYLYQIGDQYAININGYVIYGQPGRIGYGLPYSLVCKASKCRTGCQYAHHGQGPPPDQGPCQAQSTPTGPPPRNYTPTAWLTTSQRAAAGNQRLTGSIDTLADDVADLPDAELEAEINLRKSQLIHDICVLQALFHLQYKRKKF